MATFLCVTLSTRTLKHAMKNSLKRDRWVSLGGSSSRLLASGTAVLNLVPGVPRYAVLNQVPVDLGTRTVPSYMY